MFSLTVSFRVFVHVPVHNYVYSLQYYLKLKHFNIKKYQLYDIVLLSASRRPKLLFIVNIG